MNKISSKYFIDEWRFEYKGENLGSVFYVRDKTGRALASYYTKEEAKNWINKKKGAKI